VVNQPERSVSTTSPISASVNNGRKNGILSEDNGALIEVIGSLTSQNDGLSQDWYWHLFGRVVLLWEDPPVRRRRLVWDM
jgi:hypothetical protein